MNGDEQLEAALLNHGVVLSWRRFDAARYGWREVNIDMEHIDSGHTAEGNRAVQSGKKDLFPSNWTQEQREAAIREAYRNSRVTGASQGDRVFLEGQGGGLNIQMWVNKATKTIESAWPK